MRIRVPHRLAQETAIERLQVLTATAQHEYKNVISHAEQTWTGPKCAFSLRVQGGTISGGIEVAETSVDIECILPDMLRVMRPRIENMLRHLAQQVLHQ